MSYALSSQRRARPHSLHGLGCGCTAASGLGVLVEPDLSVWTPPDVLAWLGTIESQVGALSRDIAAAQVPIEAHRDGPRFLADWRDFKAQWFRYVNGWRTSVATRFADPFANQSRQFVRSYNALENRYGAITGLRPTVSSTLLAEEEASPIRNINYALMGWAVLGIAGIVGLGYLVSNYAKVKMMSKLAFNSTRRRRRRRR